ncbi:DEAD/DEAH box helicase [Clostridium grantii]|uniref:Superfamily II DNA and RNA helicase n=1 Tax=Clostridium grantii DSM 8605 TaxID=1121316 RepID=A0A1M5QM23_9CLOT|nr:DEAD/DEAH box helicase [Clostridium grantii]SHH15177.1 Superfamily II DNA and RNA helicase [Clostridium grantii DSM 8605]
MKANFENLGINPAIIEGLNKEAITIPTAIQALTIPLALENKDIIAESETGSGKTLAYLLPLFQKIDISKNETSVIILAPTHELVVQIDKEIKLLANNSGINITSTTIIGDVNIKRQVEKLKKKPNIIVGSSGRILELIKMKKIKSHTVKTIVVDEGDRLLDKNNISSIQNVIKTTLRERQLLVFSATIKPETINEAKKLMKEPELIKVTKDSTNSENISHSCIVAEQRDKIIFLRKLIAALNPKKAIVFQNKNDEIQITVDKLNHHSIKACGIYGNASKEERKKAIDGFKNGTYPILIASDIAARGLDIKDVTHIFNLDLPEDSKDYLHRVGRTGRAGKSGTAVTIVTENEVTRITRYEKELKIKIQHKIIQNGKLLNSK